MRDMMLDPKAAREGADAPLRRERQAFLDGFMDHAEAMAMEDLGWVLRTRLRILLSDAWYDGYIAGERHANSQRLLTNSPAAEQPDPKP